MTVYLLHFDKPYEHARHYLGFTDNLEKRLNEHAKGQGNVRLISVIIQAGISFELARTWPGDRSLERKLKRRHNSPKLCPICQERQK